MPNTKLPDGPASEPVVESGPVLVTGGAGYIGGHAVLALQDAGIEVCVIDDLSTGKRQAFHDTVHFYEGRVHDQDLLSQIIKCHEIRSVLHFAGSIKVDESVTNPLKYYENNTEGSRSLIEVAVAEKIKQFIFSSTAAVYGETGNEPVKESAVPAPLNPYGVSKLFTEQQLKDVCAASDMQYGIFRYFNVAGADPDLRHGQFLENPTHLIGRAIDATLGKSLPLTIFGRALPTADGTGVRDYIHVSDVVDAHLALLKHMKSADGSFLFNLGYGRGSSVLDVVTALEMETGQKVPHEFGPPRAGEAPSVIADISCLNGQLDWQPKYATLEQLLRSSYSWAKSL